MGELQSCNQLELYIYSFLVACGGHEGPLLGLGLGVVPVLSPLLWVEPVGEEDRPAEQLSQVVVFLAYILANSLMQQNSLF